MNIILFLKLKFLNYKYKYFKNINFIKNNIKS